MRISYRPDFRMDPDIWDTILHGNIILGVIAEQPERPSPHTWPEVNLKSVFEELAAWLTPIFEYLATIVPKEI